MAGVVITEALRARQQACVDVEGEQKVQRGGHGHADGGAFLDELRGEALPDGAVVHQAGPSGEVEGVLVGVRRKRVQGVAPVALEVPLFGGRDDESDEGIVAQQGTERMQAWPPVVTDGGQEGETHPDLVKQAATRLDQIGTPLSEIGPREHGEDTGHRRRPCQGSGAGLGPTAIA